MKKHGKLLLKYLLLFVMTVFVMGCFSVSAATKTGFVTQKGKTYYINKDGSKQKGWLELKGKKYYFDKKTGVQVKGWVKDSSGQAMPNQKCYAFRSRGHTPTWRSMCPHDNRNVS